MPKTKSKSPHVTVKIPVDLTNEIDNVIGQHGFKSRGEFVKQAIRALLEHYGVTQAIKLSRFDRINGDATGATIYDREGKDTKAFHISVKPTGIMCDRDETNDCEHVKYALGLRDVQEMIKKRRREGWKIDLPDE